MDREKSRAGILLWGELAPGWLGDIFLPHAGLQPAGRLQAPPGEGDGLPRPGAAALRQAAVSSWQQERGRHTQPPQNTGITSPHVISACRVPRQGGGREQLSSTLRYLNFSGLGTELRLGIRKQPGWQSSKVPTPLWCLPALLAGQSPAPSLPAKAQCRELSPLQHYLLSRHACASP